MAPTAASTSPPSHARESRAPPPWDMGAWRIIMFERPACRGEAVTMTQACVSPTMAELTREPAEQAMTVEQLFDRYALVFWRFFAVRTGNDQHAADDLMQQLWLQAHLKGRSTRAGKAEAWLWQVARNLLRFHWRKRAAAPADLPELDSALARRLARHFDREPLPDELLSRREVRDQLLLALTELAAEQQLLLIGYYFEGRSESALAQELAMSPRAIEGRLYRARRALRDKLAHLKD
jgi:RNA polymerase sigma-70 factor (ECF subfamily)